MVATIFVRLVIPAYLAGVELIMVRHALPERKESADGVADPGLTVDGHQQAELMAAYLSSDQGGQEVPIRGDVQTE